MFPAPSGCNLYGYKGIPFQEFSGNSASNESNMRQSTAQPVYDSTQLPPYYLQELLELVRAGFLIRLLVIRDITVRYKRSLFGVVWTLLHPILMMAVLTIAFSQIMRIEVENYAVLVLSGLLVWNFISEASTTAMSNMVSSGNLLSRIYLPKAIYPVASLLSSLINMALAFLPLLILMLVTRTPLRVGILLLPLPILLTCMFTLGISLTLSSIAVYFADLVPLYSVLLRIWFYLTPIVYPLSLFPASLRWLQMLNPLTHFVEFMRAVLLQGTSGDPKHVLGSVLWACLMLLLGWITFTSRADEYAYRI
jgi:ABC-2 type transport system permease protein